MIVRLGPNYGIRNNIEGEKGRRGRNLPSLRPPLPSDWDSDSAEEKFPSSLDINGKAARSGEEQTVILETPRILLTTLEINPVQSMM